MMIIFFQIEANLARPSSVDLWEEDHIHQLQESNDPMQAIYDTDEESYVSLEPFNSEVEEDRNEETFQQVETKDPSLEKKGVIKHTPAQEYNNLFTEPSPLK